MKQMDGLYRSSVHRTGLLIAMSFCAAVLLTGVLSGCAPEQALPPAPPFKMVTGQHLFGVANVDPQHAWIVGFNASILHTADGGRTWKPQKSGVDSNLCDVTFINNRTGWISGRMGTILHTKDAGQTWQRQVSGTQHHLFALNFVDDQYGWAVGDFGTIIHTANGGQTWQRQGIDEDRIYNDVFFVSRTRGWVVGEGVMGEPPLIYYTENSGASWKLQQCPEIVPEVSEEDWELAPPSLYGIYFTDPLTGWICGMDGTIIHTTDGGRQWRKVENPAATEKVTLYAVRAGRGSGSVIGQKGTYLHMPAGEGVWQLASERTSTKFWLRAMDFCDDSNGYVVGARGTILKTENGGETWRMISGIPVRM